MALRRIARSIACMAAVALAACSSVPPPRTETYLCASGQQFSLALDARPGPQLLWNGIAFPVHAEAGREGVFACEVLTVGRDGRRAWLDLQGRPALRDCERIP